MRGGWRSEGEGVEGAVGGLEERMGEGAEGGGLLERGRHATPAQAYTCIIHDGMERLPGA